MPNIETVAVVGASHKPERYAYMAQALLTEYGHHVIPIAQRAMTVQGMATLPSLRAVDQPIDTVTLYVGPQHQAGIIDDILAVKPRRVIFNPGTENPDVYPQLQQQGIATEEACTLVLLRTRQF